MINRTLIRIKVLQVLYNYYLVSGMGLSGAIALLQYALDQSYQLYVYLTSLPLQLSELAQIRLAKEEDKHVRDEATIALLKHIVQNPITEVMSSDPLYLKKLESATIDNNRVTDFLNQLIQKAINNKEELLEADWNSLTEIKKVWRRFYGDEIVSSELFYDVLEDSNTFRNDDIGIVFTFVTKVFNGISKDKPFSEQLKPAYASAEDMDFGPALLEGAIIDGSEQRELLSKYFKNWDKERTSEMDYIIMQLAVTEATKFPQIPTKITINEYLNLAHYYSSEVSHIFINGILHELFTDLKKEGKILGN